MVLLFGVFGCQKDDFQPSQLEENKGQIPIAEIKNKSYKELKDNQKFQEAMEVVTRQKVSKDENVKTIMGFTIDSTVIKEITVGGHTSYTMYVMDGSLEGGIFKNLVVQRDSLGHVKSSLITYYPEHTNLDTGHGSFMFQGTYIAEPCTTEGLKLWNRSNSNCTEIWYCSWGGTIHFAGENCTESYMFSTMSCGSGGGGGGGSGDGIPGSGTTDGNEDWVDPHFPVPVNPVENEGEESQDPIITTPIYSIQYKQQIIDCFSGTGYLVNVSGLSFNQQRDLAQYLKQDTNNDPFDNSGTNCSDPQALAFAFDAIEAMINNNELELDFLEQIYLPLDKECQAKVVMDFTANVDSQLSNFLVNVFNGNNNFHIEIVDEDFPANITGNAATTPPVGMEFTSETAAIVRFDNEYLDNATDLSVVMTTAHEYLHVYLIYLYSQGQLLSTYPSYIDLNNAFQVFESNPNETTFQELENQSHIIYDDFLGWIQDSVNAYVEKNNLNISQEYIEKMVVGSHQYTSTFQNLSNTLQIEYSQIAVNEQNGETNANGSTCN